GQDRRRCSLQHPGRIRPGDPRRPALVEGRGRGSGDESTVTIRVAIPDLISPSYFPAIAAVEMGFLPDAKLELLYPVTKTYEELREGRLDFVGGASHAVLLCIQDLAGAPVLC